MNANFRGIPFQDSDVVDTSAWIPDGEYNPHNVRPWLIYCEYGTLAVVFANNEQDALDEAADAGKLDGYRIPDEELGDENEDFACLGNASEPFDLTYIGIEPLPNVALSFCTLFNAGKGDNN